MSEAKLFPMFLKLAGRHCLVVGAGTIGESKIAGLMETGAHVRVVTPVATEQVKTWVIEKKIVWEKREFRVEDLDGMFLVIAATSSTELHKEIFDAATKRGVLCNIVDVPPLCDFYYPAVVQRGSLQIAISTSGQSPALAQRLRKELEEQFGPEYENWLNELGAKREALQNKSMDADERKRIFHEQASRESFEAFRLRWSGAKSKG
jgi:precorrin-2 dehydrogenase/sirohydrochlorin ferrochelatase